MMNYIRKNFLFIFFAFVCFLLYPSLAFADKRTITCAYKGKDGKDVLVKAMNNKRVPLTITIYDDGTVKPSVASGSKVTDSSSALWNVSGDFNKNGSYYKASYNSKTKKYSCPTISLVYQEDSVMTQLGLYNGKVGNREGIYVYEATAKAKEKVTNQKMATCTYKGANGGDVIIKELGDQAKIPLSISIYEDGLIETSVTSATPVAANPNAYWYVSGDFNKNGSYYKAAYNASSKTYSCPDINLAYQTGGGMVPQLGMYAAIKGSMAEQEGTSVYTVSATPSLTDAAKKAGASVQGKEIMCERDQPVLFDQIGNIHIIFYKEGNVKKFSISYKDDPNKKGTALSDGTIKIGIHSYQVRQSDVEKYWTKRKDKKCSLLYIKKNISAQGTTGQQLMTIQSTKPSNEENGSYDYDDAKKDNGTEKNPLIDYMPSSSVDPSTSAALKRSTCEIINVNTGLGRFLNKMVNYIRIGVIFLVLVLGMVDLMGAVGASEEGAFKKAGTRFFKRLIAAALVFLVPAIVNILISLINDASCAGDPNYDPTGGIFDNHA